MILLRKREKRIKNPEINAPIYGKNSIIKQWGKNEL